MNTEMENGYVVGLGEILFDVFPTGSQLGGAPANFAYHAAQHGLHSVTVSAIGKDSLGEKALHLLQEKNLEHELPIVNFPTGSVQVTLDQEGVPSYEIKRDVAWDNIPFNDKIRQIATHTRSVCWGTLAQRNEISRNSIYCFLDHTPKDSLKIFDINLRQNFYTKEIIKESLRRCNILKINDEELVTIGRLFGYPGLDMENKCWLILGKYSLDMLVLTCGVNGSYVFAPGFMSYQKTPKVDVTDTVGAGDSFTGTFCAGILKGMPITEAHEQAVKVSAYVCTQSRAMPQLPEELKL